MVAGMKSSRQTLTESSMTDAPALRQVMGRLVWLRMISNLAQVLVLVLVLYGLRIDLYVWPLASIILGLWLVNMVVLWRMRWRFAVTELEIMLQLALDMIGLAGLVYWSGGSTNPFISLLLVPIALSAAFLRVPYIVALVVLGALLYSLLLRYYVPLPPVGSRFGGDFNLHILGMWASFLLSSVIAAIFVYKLAQAGRDSERKLGEARDSMIRNEHIVAVGAMAAGTAHEMNTPLATIGMLADEIAEGAEQEEQVREDAAEISRQVARCRDQLKRLQFVSKKRDTVTTETDSLKNYLAHAVSDWSAMRSEIEIDVSLELADNEQIRDRGGLLAQALANLLNNAADASLENERVDVALHGYMRGENLCLDIDDFGPGLSDAQLKIAGKSAFTSKQKGMGLGLVLSHSTLENLGGEIRLTNRENGGVRAAIQVPMENLR